MPQRGRLENHPRAEAQGWWGYSAIRRSLGIDPWGLVLGVHATLGDQQDSSQDNQDGAANIQDDGALTIGGGGQNIILSAFLLAFSFLFHSYYSVFH